MAAAVDAGAPLVIGHHPHVPHGVSTYVSINATANSPGRPAYILGSLGNFVFDQTVYETLQSYVAIADVANCDGKGSDSVYVARLALAPYRSQNFSPR